jgi:2-methylcitrate synthase
MRVAACRELHPSLKQALELMPASAPPMDVMRTTTSFLGLLYPEEGNPPFPADKALCVFERALGALPAAMLYWHHFHTSGERVDTTSPKSEESLAEHFLRVLHGSASPVATSPLAVRSLDGSLILYAEHEMTASTFSSRLCASTLSDAWSCLTGAIGTLKGPLHGGANEAAHKMLTAWSDPQTASDGVKAMLAKKKN